MGGFVTLQFSPVRRTLVRPLSSIRHTCSVVLFESRPNAGGATHADYVVVHIEDLDQ